MSLFDIAAEGRCMACGAVLDGLHRCHECGECWGSRTWNPEEEKAMLKKLGRTE